NRTRGKVLGFVRAADADLVVLVDARRDPWQPVLSALRTLYSHQAPRDPGPGRVMLFSRHPILAERMVRPPGGLRPYLVADVALGDETVVVAGVHSVAPSLTGPDGTHRRNRQLD